MGLVIRWKICTQQSSRIVQHEWDALFNMLKKGPSALQLAFLPAKHATSPCLAKDKPRIYGACGQARIQFHSVPTRPQRVGAIPSTLWLAIFLQWTTSYLPSPSLAAFEASRLRDFAVFLWRIRAPSPPLEILSRISLERMARNSRTRPCLHAFKSFSFWLITRISSQTPYLKVNGSTSGKGHGIFRQCESG